MKVIHRFRDEAKNLEFKFELPTAKILGGAITIRKEGISYQVDELLHVHNKIDLDDDTMTMLYFCDFIMQT